MVNTYVTSKTFHFAREDDAVWYSLYWASTEGSLSEMDDFQSWLYHSRDWAFEMHEGRVIALSEDDAVAALESLEVAYVEFKVSARARGPAA